MIEMPNTDKRKLTKEERSKKYNNGRWDDKKNCECGTPFSRTTQNRYGTNRVCENPDCDISAIQYNQDGEIVRIIRCVLI